MRNSSHSPRHASRQQRRLAPALVSLLIILAPLGAPTAAPIAYTADYKVRVYGLRGSLEIEQSPAERDAVWRYRTVLKAKGIAKLFARGTTVEEALYEVREDGLLRPLEVTADDEINDKRREVRFIWPDDQEAGLQAEGVDQGDAFSLEVPLDALDRLLLVPAIALDLQVSGAARDADGQLRLRAATLTPGKGYRFRVLERGRLRDYYARLLGEETLEGPDGGALETLVFEHQRDGSRRATTFWLAPALDYLPVQIQQRKDDKKPHLRATLQDYKTVDTPLNPR